MKLRYRVDMENSFRQGVDCSSSVQVIDVNPQELPQNVRAMIADRLSPGTHLGEEVMDVCCLNGAEASIEEDVLEIPRVDNLEDPEATWHLVMADLPGLEHLIAAVQKEDADLTSFFSEKQLKYSKRSVM